MPLALLILGAFVGLLAINGKYKDALDLLGNAIKKAPGASVSLAEALAGIVLVAALFRAVELPRAGEAFLLLLVVAFMTVEGSTFLSQFEQAAAGIGSGSSAAGSSGNVGVGSGLRAAGGAVSAVAPWAGSLSGITFPSTGGQ